MGIEEFRPAEPGMIDPPVTLSCPICLFVDSVGLCPSNMMLLMGFNSWGVESSLFSCRRMLSLVSFRLLMFTEGINLHSKDGVCVHWTSAASIF